MRRLGTSVVAAIILIIVFAAVAIGASLSVSGLHGAMFARAFLLFVVTLLVVAAAAILIPLRAIRALAHDRQQLITALAERRTVSVSGPLAGLSRLSNALVEENRDLAVRVARASTGADREERLAAIGRLAAGLAHELRNPLTSVIGLCALARESCEDDRLCRDLKAIESEARRCEAISESILAFSRTPRLNLGPVDLASFFVASSTEGDVLGGGILPAGLTIRLDVAPEAARFIGDVTLLGRVFTNLLANARDAGATSVEVRARRSGAMLKIDVLDDGRGIPAAMLDQLFDAFATSRAGGLGLGLPISRGIVTAHGGTLAARNRPEGGADFVMELPVQPAEKS